MKRTKFYIYVAALLTLLTVLSSCASNATTLSLGDTVNKKTTYKSDHSVYTHIEEITDVAEMELIDQKGDLMYFAPKYGKEKHLVYNARTNKTVLNITQDKKIDYSIDLYFNSDYGYGYFIVTSKGDSIKTELYSEHGTQIATADKRLEATNAVDLVYFNGNCYRVNSEQELKYVFNHLTAKDLKDIVKWDKYYYSFSQTNTILVYDNNFNFISRYDSPEYAEKSGGFVLENGNIFFQYLYKADPTSNDYTIFYEDTKYNVVTLTINHKNGKTKTINCDYIVSAVLDAANADGFDVDPKLFPLVEAFRIENQRAAATHWGTINNDGELLTLKGVNDSFLLGLERVSENRWFIKTDTGSYLIDKKGNVIYNNHTNYKFEFTSDKYILALENNTPALILDYSFKQLYSIKANKFEFLDYVGSSIVLHSPNEEYVIYTGEGSPKTIISKNDDKKWVGTLGNCYVLKNSDSINPTFELYNSDGELLIAIKSDLIKKTDQNKPFTLVSSGEDYTIICIRNESNYKTFYRLGV